MKAWLLALVVVALVGTDPGHTLKCCTNLSCFPPVECAEGQDSCISVHVKGFERFRGCAQNCTYPEPFEKNCCCKTDKCNMLL
uniref:Three finger toxin n=1 Tax=Python regius TaxID=51751 RepID=A0A098LWQ5_PYTRG